MELYEAIQDDDEHLACVLVYRGANPNELYVERGEELRGDNPTEVFVQHGEYPQHMRNLLFAEYEDTLWTRLSLSAGHRLVMLTRVLLLKGAKHSPHIRVEEQESPLMHAIWGRRDSQGVISAHLIRILLEDGGESENVVPFAVKELLRSRTWNEWTDEHHDALRTIVEIKPGIVNTQLGLLAIRLDAVQDRKAMDILVEAGANIDAPDLRGDSALQCLCTDRNEYGNCYSGIVKGFLGHGAEPNAVNEHGNTPLITVVRIDSEHADVVDVLLRGGADETIVGSDGMVAVDFARERGHENTVQLLVNAPTDRRWRRRGLITMCITKCTKHGGVVVPNNDDWTHVAEWLVGLGRDGGIFRTIIGFL